jgi:hypothetical protein
MVIVTEVDVMRELCISGSMQVNLIGQSSHIPANLQVASCSSEPFARLVTLGENKLQSLIPRSLAVPFLFFIRKKKLRLNLKLIHKDLIT